MPALSRNKTVKSLVWISAAAVAAAVDLTARVALPSSLHAMAPLLAFAVGGFVGRGLARAERTVRETEPAPSRVDRAIAELEPLFTQRDAVAPSGANGGPASANVLAFPAARAQPASVRNAVGELEQYDTFTEILSKQLLGVTTLSENAAKSILGNLTGLDAKISALLTYIQQSGSNDQVMQVVGQIEEQMRGCQVLLDQFADRQKIDAKENMIQRGQIESETKGVLEALDGVKDIARHTTILSFNVSIEAARAGEAAGGFTVIATEIRRLASEVQILSADVHSRVETLMQTIKVDLHAQTQRREEVSRIAIANIAETLRSLTDNLMTLITHQRDILQKVEIASEAIAGPLLDMMGSIQFQDIIRQQLEQLDRMAATVGEHVGVVATMLAEDHVDLDSPTLSEKIDELFKSYVMADQRNTHLEVRGQAAAPSAAVASIELF